ncbi:MAG: carboxylating nicotinate-nucleotide diphosphorylase [Halobacteriales archaeon]
MTLSDLVRAYLDEDAAWRDHSSAIVEGEFVSARAVAKEGGVVAGLRETRAVYDEVRPGVTFEGLVEDGERVDAGDDVFSVEGEAAGVLRGERLALNVLCAMSGVASVTRDCVESVDDVRVAATRKTHPGFRFFEKRAVEIGGGDPHRYDLADAVMVKDNHVEVLGLEEAVERAVERSSFTSFVEVEAESAEVAVRAAEMGVDAVLLDNMSPGEVEEAVAAIEGFDVVVEVSGGVRPDNLGGFDLAGVDVVSMGSLVHSSDWMDFSLRVV